jgi:hypothetical protein
MTNYARKCHSELWRSGLRSGAVIALALCIHGNGYAFEINTGNPDVAISWDNTLRYNLGFRAQGLDSNIGNSVVNQLSDYRFQHAGNVVTNRADLLSEFDFTYKEKYGFRVSAEAWYDAAYGGGLHPNPGIEPVSGLPYSALGSYVNNQYTSYTSRYFNGPSAELLDAFAFGSFNLGPVPVNVKLGQHTVYWGESLFSLNGISYSQAPVDLAKALANPGTEAKELYLPLPQLSMQAQVTDTLSVAAQYMFDWEPSRFPEGGTYLGFSDILLRGPNRLPVTFPGGAAFIPNGQAVNGVNHGAFGINTRWNSDLIGGTLGVYYRRFDETFPWLLLSPDSSSYRAVYAKNTQLLGMSFAKSIAGISVGSEISYRKNTALASAFAPATEGARGDVMELLVNTVGYIGKTPIFDAANWIVEVGAGQLINVRSNAQLFNGVDYQACAGEGKWQGCATKRNTSLSVAFTPTWYQVFPGVDLTMPSSISWGIYGNDPTAAALNNQGAGSFSVGFSADVRNKYTISLAYNGYFGKYQTNGHSVTTSNGGPALISDRGWVSLTLKATL